MIRHCVLVHFRDSVNQERRDALFNEVSALQSHLTGILGVHTGATVSPETGMDKGYANGFIVDFTDPHARDAYLVDEEHQRVGARLVEAAEGGAAGILVFDLDIPSA